MNAYVGWNEFPQSLPVSSALRRFDFSEGALQLVRGGAHDNAASFHLSFPQCLQCGTHVIVTTLALEKYRTVRESPEVRNRVASMPLAVLLHQVSIATRSGACAR